MLALVLACVHPVLHRTPQVAVRGLADDDWLAVRFDLDPDWHIYWVNPGDSGMATDIRTQDPRVGRAAFPTPMRFLSPGDIESFGYADRATILLPFDRTSDDLVELDAAWLVCKEVCLYQEALVRIDPTRRTDLSDEVAALPQPGTARATAEGWTVLPGQLFPSPEFPLDTVQVTDEGIHVEADARGHWFLVVHDLGPRLYTFPENP